MELNQKVLDLLKANDIDADKGLLYLLALHFDISPDVCFDDEFRKSLYDQGFIDSDGKARYVLFGDGLEKFDEFMDKWLALWPSQPFKDGIIEYPIHGSKPQATSRMRAFLRDFYKHCPYWKGKRMAVAKKQSLILIATRTYLAYQEQKAWAFTKKNVKFISDRDGSHLAAWIDKCRTQQLHRILPKAVLTELA